MYLPIYNYNDKILNNISKIEFARGIINQSRIIPEIDATLKINAIIQSVHASTAIEGNTLTTDEVGKLINGFKVIARKKEKQEVLNYSHLLKKIDKYHKNGKVTEKLLLKMHAEITKNALNNNFYEGFYRDVNVRVENLKTHEIRFMPPNYMKVHSLMEDLIYWINSSNDISPIIVAGVAHYEFVRIHPFIDGNGRTARALATLILYIRDYDTKRYFTMDEYYDKDRKAYVDALKSADDSCDLTEWLEYFTEGFLISVLKVKNDLSRILDISPIITDLDKQLTLNESQIKIITSIQREGKITNSETRKLLGISAQAAHSKLTKLKDLDIIQRKGSGRSTYYVLNRISSKQLKFLDLMRSQG